MLKKFVGITGIGTFRNCLASGDVEMKKMTLIHGENGRGKSTLCAIIRSLKSGNANLVLERRTIDGKDAPQIKLLFDHGLNEFKDGAWAARVQQVEIFDANFVAENVYTGDLITHDHKKNLCRIVLGTEGVKLAQKFDDLDAQVRTLSSLVNVTRDAAQRFVPNGLTLDQYIELAVDPEIDKKIEEKKREIERVKFADQIRARPMLGTIALPQPPRHMSDTLAKTIDGVSANAEQLMAEHLEKHGMQSANWLGEGLKFVTAECPFCAQDLKASKFLGAIKDYFNAAYRAFQNELAQFRRSVEEPLSDTSLLRVQKAISENDSHAEFWRSYARVAPPNRLSFEEQIQPVINGLRETLEPLIRQKLAMPLEVVRYSVESQAATEEWENLRDIVLRYNADVVAYNTNIQEIKRTISTKSLTTLTGELVILEATRRRVENTTIVAILTYAKAQEDKAKVEFEKEAARDALNTYNEKIVSHYQTVVNDLLERFGTSFRLGKVEVEYTGRTPRVGYTFTLRGKEVHPGSDTTPAGTPCFGNTLSAGDRSTLALAFFIAQIKMRTDVANLVVVFDDPFTSLDAFRQTWTCNSIRTIAGMAKQVIVLSHSLEFLRLVAQRWDKPNMKSLKIDVVNDDDSRIFELDLDAATALIPDKDVVTLRNYYTGDESDALAAIRTIRPLLENHIRKMAAKDCPEGYGWLGDFLGRIKDANDVSPLAQFKPIYDDLDCLNTYTSPYYHDGGKAPQINPAELRINGKLTLKLIGRPV